jgi:hypothetical protein
VHWQVDYEKPGGDPGKFHPNWVLLHVESPKREKNAGLNDLRKAVIEALRESNAQQLAQQAGYGYVVGPTRLTKIPDSLTTQAFKVVVPDGRGERTLQEYREANIRAVHAAVGSAVDEVLQRFAGRLQEAWNAGRL